MPDRQNRQGLLLPRRNARSWMHSACAFPTKPPRRC